MFFWINLVFVIALYLLMFIFIFGDKRTPPPLPGDDDESGGDGGGGTGSGDSPPELDLPPGISLPGDGGIDERELSRSKVLSEADTPA